MFTIKQYKMKVIKTIKLKMILEIVSRKMLNYKIQNNNMCTVIPHFKYNRYCNFNHKNKLAI